MTPSFDAEEPSIQDDTSLLWYYNSAKHFHNILVADNSSVNKKVTSSARSFITVLPELYRLPILHYVRECLNQVLLNEVQLMETTLICIKAIN